ncbi:PilN domain-containing protein [Halonatronum saccharophilum]|uniref:PilN domain-containing protein n=1 Tax=Halonatronum saccharophilum TaxID=150060 RepID=UPI0004852708|nr:PilN domain-containing protein [Halonatronum saccharophilum]
MINLMPREFLLEQRYKSYKKFSILILISVILIVISYSNILNKRLEGYKRGIHTIENEVNNFQNIIDTEEEIYLLVKDIDYKIQKINSLSSSLNHSYLLNDLNFLIPKGIWLTYFKIDGDKGVGFRGEGLGNAEVVEVLDSLEAYQFFYDMDIDFMNQKEGERVKFYLKGRYY